METLRRIGYNMAMGVVVVGLTAAFVLLFLWVIDPALAQTRLAHLLRAVASVVRRHRDPHVPTWHTVVWWMGAVR